MEELTKENKKTVRETLEEKYGDLSGLIAEIRSDDEDGTIHLPAGLSMVEFKDLIDEVDNEPLGAVIGHDEQKKEILMLMDWFNRSKELREKGVSIPHGVLLYGHPGDGKTLLIKEIVRSSACPVFVFKGEQDNIEAGILDTFKKAREAGHAIVVFDELDLLIDKESRVARVLQEELDGVESEDDILVLAATNSLSNIPSPLLRNGRLEKLIHIPDPTGKEAFLLLEKHFKEFGVSFPEDLDQEGVELALEGVSCAAVKSIVNDIVLRNGFTNITSQMIDDSIYRIQERSVGRSVEPSLNVAVHEAAHCLMAKAYPEFFKVSRLTLSNWGDGEFQSHIVEPVLWTYPMIKADIKVLFAGIVAEKLLCGMGSRGCESDLQRARKEAYNLFNVIAYSSCWETLPVVSEGSRRETPTKLRKMERKIERFLRKCEKETVRFVKKNAETIRRLGNLLLEKKHLKSTEILACIGG